MCVCGTSGNNADASRTNCTDASPSCSPGLQAAADGVLVAVVVGEHGLAEAEVELDRMWTRAEKDVYPSFLTRFLRSPITANARSRETALGSGTAVSVMSPVV